MLKKYRIKILPLTAKIEEVEALRETELSVFLPTNTSVKERREMKRNEWTEYYDSWEEARAALAHKAESKTESARQALERANAFADAVKGMSRP